MNKNVLILTQWPFRDALIQAYTLPYVKIIRQNISSESKIILVTFENSEAKTYAEELSQDTSELEKIGVKLKKFRYPGSSILLFLKSIPIIINLIQSIRREKIDIIHAWCTPAGSLGYLLSILTGRKLIIDSFEPHAEAMVENLTWKKNQLKYRILSYFEKKLTLHAHVIISATEGMRNFIQKKYQFTIKNFLVKPACVDLKLFNTNKRKDSELLKRYHLENKIVCVYAGKFDGIYLSSEIFDFLKVAENHWGNRFTALLLTNHNRQEIKTWATNAGLSEKSYNCLFVSHHEIPLYMGLGDFAITPVKPIPTKRFCSPIKDGEYWGLGLPVVITKDISDDSDIIEDNNIGAVLRSLTTSEYKNAIVKIEHLIADPQNTASKIHAIAEKYRSYTIAEEIYHSIYKQNNYNL